LLLSLFLCEEIDIVQNTCKLVNDEFQQNFRYTVVSEQVVLPELPSADFVTDEGPNDCWNRLAGGPPPDIIMNCNNLIIIIYFMQRF